MHVSLLLKICLVMLESYKGAIRELPIGAEALWLLLAWSWGAGRVLCAFKVGLTFKLVVIMVRVVIFIIVLMIHIMVASHQGGALPADVHKCAISSSSRRGQSCPLPATGQCHTISVLEKIKS